MDGAGITYRIRESHSYCL